jgi:glycosyltransferase involved in cell wall biosynthesis
LSVEGAIRTPQTESGADGRRLEHSCRISIIVPTRNRPQLLARMLASVRAQAWSSYEVIVIDDASTPETRDCYSAIWDTLDSRFTLLSLGSPGAAGVGPSVARNTGIATARGAIVAFCDDDDFWTSTGHLAAMAAVFDAEPRVDMYIANQTAVSCTGTVERSDWLPGLIEIVRDRPRSAPNGYLVSPDDLVRCGGFAQLNILAIRRETALAIGGFWTRTSYEEDRDFFWRAVDRARAIFFNPEVVAQHNVPDPSRRDNLSRSFTQAERWLISALVSQHIALSVTNSAVRSLCLSYEGDILRHLSLSLSREGQHALGLQYARRALAARGSFKWALYTISLMCRQLLRRQAA